jgi:chromosome segregation ATPase
MSKEKSTDFKIDLEDISSNQHYQDELTTLKIEKLGHRITLLAILIPCLIGVILYVAYRDIQTRVIATHNTETREVQTLSKSMDDRLNESSKKMAALETALSKLEKKQTAVNNKIRALNQSKLDKKEKSSFVRQMEKKISPIDNQVKDITNKLPGLEKSVTEKLADLKKTMSDSLENTKNDLDQVQIDISHLSKNKLNRETLAVEMLKEQKKLDQHFTQAMKRIDDRLDFMLKRILALERIWRNERLKPKNSIKSKLPDLKPGGSASPDKKRDKVSEKDI